MKRKITFFLISVMMISLAGCGEISEKAIEPLMGLEWFQEEENVNKIVSENADFQEEREVIKDELKQKMFDYNETSLFNTDCTLTVCFTDQGLVGLNYHDIDKNKNYSEWYYELETIYGVSSENGNGIASWYTNPLGKNTAVYLFNLEEGVQISFYATADTPDKTYMDMRIPAPEIRTPVNPDPLFVIIDDDIVTEATTVVTTEISAETEPVYNEIRYDGIIRRGDNQWLAYTPEYVDQDGNVVENVTVPVVTSVSEVSIVTEVPVSEVSVSKSTETAVTTTPATSVTTRPVTTTKVTTTTTSNVKIEKGDDFYLDVLKFYMGAESGKNKMSAYTMTDEYRIEEPGTPWEIVNEYSGVTYRGKNCDVVLCYTSLGLVGINYFENNSNAYSGWTETMRRIYGIPSYSESDYTLWERNIDGTDVMICVFSLEDCVQISFFADDTGSEAVR